MPAASAGNSICPPQWLHSPLRYFVPATVKNLPLLQCFLRLASPCNSCNPRNLYSCFLSAACQNARNLRLAFSVHYVIDTGMSSDNKHTPPPSDFCADCSGHAPRLEDQFVTRRQFLQKAGMGFGALSAAALFGETLFGGGQAQAIEQ